MKKSYYSIALAFFNAKSKEDTDHFVEEDCRIALRFLMLDFAFLIKPLTLGAYRITYESNRTVCFKSAKQTLRFLEKQHKFSQVWFIQAGHKLVVKLAGELAEKVGDGSPDTMFLDEAARQLCTLYFQRDEVKEQVATHFALATA